MQSDRKYTYYGIVDKATYNYLKRRKRHLDGGLLIKQRGNNAHVSLNAVVVERLL